MARDIVFRRIREEDGAHYWYVEAYSDEGSMFPVGTAYVLVYESVVQLNFMFVADQWRGQGFANEILQAVKTRWPHATATGAMNKTSQHLRTKYFPETEEA